jgi:hypothetical protein
MKFILRFAAVGALLLFSQISLAAPVAEDADFASIGTEDLASPAAIAAWGTELQCDPSTLTSMCKTACACVKGSTEPLRCDTNPQCVGKCKCVAK